MFRLSAALENGMKVIIDEELPLERAAEAHKKVAAGNKAGTMVLLCGKV